MDTKTFMLFRGVGTAESDNLAAVTIACDKIVRKPDRILLYENNGLVFATITLAEAVKTRVVGA